MMQLPKIKKRISDFLLNEEGRISKQSLVSMGAFLSGAALGSLMASINAHAGDGGGGGGGGDGSDSPCCFAAGTMITMADRSKKPIEEVKIGDLVLGYDLDREKLIEAEVLELRSPLRNNHYKIYFADGRIVDTTNDHPFYFRNGSFTGWASIIPSITKEGYKIDVEKLEKGFEVLTDDSSWVRITDIVFIDEPIQTYDLKSVSECHTYFAEGFLVHNDGKDGTHTSGSVTITPSPYCPDNPNSDPAVEKGCDAGHSGCSDLDPGYGLGWDKDGLIGHNAYNENGDPIIYGDGKCSNDDVPFHFNGIHFSYTGSTLASQHHHHASHNSY